MKNVAISIITILTLLSSSSALAVQHWYHNLGRSHTESLGVAISTGSDAPPGIWTSSVRVAIKEWSDETDISPFLQTEGYENITIFQDPDAWRSGCAATALVCVQISGGEKQGGDRSCLMNLSTAANDLGAAKRITAILHEIGHCYSLDHNDQYYVDNTPDEDVNLSLKELMHISGCPKLKYKCGVTPQAKSTINTAY